MIKPPMLAKQYDCRHTYTDIFVQPKLDGIRCLLTKDGGYSRLLNKFAGLDFLFEYSKIKEFFVSYPDHVLDGELYSIKYNFNELSSLLKKKVPTREEFDLIKKNISYFLFDYYTPRNDQPFGDRNYFIDYYFRKSEIYTVPTHFMSKFDESSNIIEQWMQKSEGVMIRSAQSRYVHGRTDSLIKFKKFLDNEFLILDISSGRGMWNGHARSLVCSTIGGETFKANIALNMEEAAKLLQEKDKYINGVATVEYQELTPRGVPRFGRAKKFYKKGQEKI